VHPLNKIKSFGVQRRRKTTSKEIDGKGIGGLGVGTRQCTEVKKGRLFQKKFFKGGTFN